MDKLKQQITDKQNNNAARYHLTDKQAADGKTVNRPWMSEKWSRDDGKTIEDLQKELAAAERQLANAEVDLKYATEWRHYDADMEWMDTVKNSGQDWGFVSDNLGTMASNLEAKYNEQLAAYTEAQKQNKALDDRRGRVPAEVGYTYTSPEQLAQMYAELQQTGELRDMANRRYGYSLDELASNDKQSVERGKLRADHIAEMEERAYSENIGGYIESMESGQIGSVTGVDIYKGNRRDFRPTDTWNDEQLNRYYVILDRQGEQAAADFAVKTNTYNNLLAQQEGVQGAYDWGNAENGIGRGLAVTAATVATSPERLVSFVDKARRVEATGVYTGTSELWAHDYLDAAAQGRAEKLNELGTVAGKGLGDIYQLTNSMAQSLVYGNMVGSAGTLVMFFGQAADQGFDDAMSRGATPEQAVSFGLLSGVAEAAAELVPLENLLNADKTLTRGFLKSAMIQAGLEGLEEGETNVMNALADQLVMGDKSTMNQAIQERMAAGESYEDAARAEWGNFVKDTVWSMLGGAISGAGSSAIQYGITMASPYQVAENGASIYGATAEQLGREAAAVTDNKKLSELGKKVETKAKAGKDITNYTAKKLAEGTNRASIVSATEAQIKERATDLSAKDARALANAVVSESRGEKNGPGNQKLLEQNRALADELLTELGKDGNVAEWAREIGVRGIDSVKYGNKDEQDLLRSIQQDMEKIDSDASAVVEDDMSTEVSIGDVTGTVSGLKLSNGKPKFAVTNSEGKEQYVNVDEAISSGALPAGMARLAYNALGFGSAAADVYRLYAPGQSVNEYVAAMDEAISIASEVSKREAFDNSDAAQSLTSEQKDFAWSYGQSQRTEKQERRKANKGGKRKPAKAGTVDFGGVTINGTTYKATTKDKVKAADLRVIERIAKAANVNVVFYESDSIDGMYQGANGFYRNGTVYLDVHAAASKTTQQDAILLTAAHELTHHIRLNAEAQYEALQEFIIEHLLENGHDFETMVQDKLREKGMSRADAVEEVVADACEMVLKDSKAVEKLAKENKSLAQTIADWLHEFYEDIKAAFEGVEARSKEAKAMTNYMDELVKLWDDALIEASKGESKQSGVKYSDRGISKMYRLEEQLNNWANMKPNDTFLVGATPKVWRDVGLANLPVTINQQHIDYAVNGTKDADHHLGIDMVKQLPQAIKKPIAIIRSDTRTSDSVVVVLKLEHTLPDGTKKQVIAPVNVNGVGSQNNVSFDANTISSYFGKGNILEKMRDAINDELSGKTAVYWINKKEAYNVMSAAGLQLPSHTLHSGFIHSISESGSPVNQKITDITDSRQFKSWFGKSKIVDDNGRPMVVYHGSTDKEIRTFRTNNVMGTGGLYLTSDKAVADVFAGKNGKVYPAYARVENPLIIDADYVMYDSIPADKVPNGLRKKFPSWDSFDTNAIVMWARENGRYDGVWIKNVREAGMYSYADDIVIFDPNQIKSIYNVGTFGKTDNIYYSRRDTSEGLTKEEARAQAQAYTRLKADNAALQRKLDYWKGQTKRTKQRTINRGDVDKYAKQLVKQFGSEIDVERVKQALNEMGDILVQNEGVVIGTLEGMAQELAYDILSEVYADDRAGFPTNAEDIIADIKDITFKLDRADFDKLPEGFRKKYSGKIHISSKDGLDAADAYNQLRSEYAQYEDLFPAEISDPIGQLAIVAEAYDTLTAEPVKYNPYENHINETSLSLAYDILDTLMGETIGLTAPTMADKAAARIEQIKREEAAKRKEMGAKEKAAKWDKVAAVKAHYQGMIKRQNEVRKENAATKKYMDRALDKINTLSNWLIKNSDKEHIPEGLKAPLIEFLESIDPSSKTLLKKGKTTKKDESYETKMQRLRDVLAKQKAYMADPSNNDGLDVYLDLPDGFDDSIRLHIESVRDILANRTDVDTGSPLAYMTSEQLKDLDFILTTLTKSISQINKFITESHFASVIEGAQDSMEFLRTMGDTADKTIGKEQADKFLAWSNALPIYVFKRFGAAGQERFAALINGWSKMALNVEAAIKFAEDTYNGDEAQQWEESIHEIKLSNGRTVRMTEAQIMGLHCSFKREQARNHLLAGGMRVGDIVPTKANKEKVSQADAYQLTVDDIVKITGVLSERQIEVADKIQNYFNTVCADWGNEVSMARFGYRQFTETNYYPITTDPNNHPAVDPQARETDIFRLLNMSATKALTPNANNSIVIFSIFDVFSAHAADMAKYNALALPILDLLKWYNYKDKQYRDVKDSSGKINRQLRVNSVQGSVERTYGKMAQEYMINFLKDLNGKREGGRNEGFLKGLLGKYKAAAVGANLRVAIQQPTSIVRATYMIDPVYLARGAAKKGGVEKAMKHSGLAVWKSLGYFDTNISRNMRQQIKHADTTIDKIREKSMKLAELGDKVTWGAIWNACELEQMDKGLSGEKLKKATTDRFNEIILSTQVLDSTISRSDMMRNQSLAVSEITSFMSEPTVSYNILMDSMMEFEMTRRQTGSITEARKQTWPKMANALKAFAFTTFATAAAAAIIDAMRDDDEYTDYVEKWLEHLGENFWRSINPITLLPGLSQAWDILFKNETQESMVWQSFMQAKKGVTSLVDMVKLMLNPEAEVNDPNRTSWGRLYYVAQAVGSLSGIPVAGFMREFKTVWNMSGRLLTGKALKNYDSGIKNNIKYALLDGNITEEEAIALLTATEEYDNPDDIYWQVQEWLHVDDESEWTRYDELNAAMLAGNKDAFAIAQDNLGDHGIASQSVRNHAKGQIGKWFVGEEGIPAKINEGTARQYLQKFAGLTPIESQHLVDEWKFEKTTGFKWSELKDEYVKGTFDDKTTQGYLINYGHEYSKDAAKKVQQWKCEKETGVSYSYLSDAYIHGEITDKQAVSYLQKYGGESQTEAETKVAQWGLVNTLGIVYSSSDAGIKKNLIEGYISPETAVAAMIAMGKTPEEAEDYVNQYHFTEETGYAWSEIEEAYADGIITYDEMVNWFMEASLYTHGSVEIAEEYARVAEWKKNIPDADSINRTALEKWDTKGDYMQRAGLNEVDFTDAWSLYSESYSQYDANGNKVKEKAQVFFEKLFNLMRQGVYTEDEIDAIARTVYSKSYVNKYAMW